MKKQLTILAAIMVALAIPNKAMAYDFTASTTQGQILYYRIVDGGAEVTYSNSNGNYQDNYNNIIGPLVIPSSVEYNGDTYAVVSIGYYAFYNCSGLTSVTIPESITNIGNRAFSACNGLTSVYFNADSCIKIGGYNVNTTMNGDLLVFGEQSITNFVFGNNVKIIPMNICRLLTGLTSVTIPDSVTFIT